MILVEERRISWKKWCLRLLVDKDSPMRKLHRSIMVSMGALEGGGGLLFSSILQSYFSATRIQSGSRSKDEVNASFPIFLVPSS